MHDCSRVGDGVIHLELVRPPIGKSRCSRSVTGNFVGHLVALQYMLQGADFDAETFHGSQKYENFVLSIGVTMDEPLASDDFQDCLQFQISPLRRSIALLSLPDSVAVLAGGGEAVGEKRFHSHSRLRETRGVLVTPIGLLDVFSEGELDATWGLLHQHRIR